MQIKQDSNSLNNDSSAKLSQQHRSFLNKRGITDSVLDAFSIHTKDVPFLRLSEAIVIPINHVDGTFSFNKYRRNPIEVDVKPKYLYDKGGKITLYGADKLVADSFDNPERQQERVIITEGELDTLVCWSLNIPAVSSTGGAQSFQEEWTQLLKNYEVYICFDNDEAGHKGAIKVLDYLPDSKVIFIPSTIPGVKDISDFVGRGGDFHALMRSAKSYTSVEEVEEESQKIAASWGDNSFHRLFVEHRNVPSLPADTVGKAARREHDPTDRVGKAKAVECTSLVEFKRTQGGYKAMCLWHNDSEPSLHYYPKKNNCYCFACGKYADAIDIVMARDGLTFLEAVKVLNK